MRVYAAALLSFFLLIQASVAWAIIPEDRTITWEPGVPGGIPDYPVCATVTEAPYLARGDGNTDDSESIKAAIASCPSGQAVFFPAGTYRINQGLEVVGKGIVLRGAGPEKTTIINASTKPTITMRNNTSLGTPSAIVGGMQKGSTNLMVSDPQNFTKGQIIYISQLNDPSFVTIQGYSSPITWGGLDGGTRSMVQINEIAEVEGNTLRLVRPLYFTFQAEFSPLAQRVNMVRGGGVEDMRLEQVQGVHTANTQQIQFTYIRNSWVKNVVSLYPRGAHVQLRNSFRSTVRDSYFADAAMTISGRGYGVFIFGPNSDHLIENNVVSRSRHSLIFEGGGSGCVFGYNYAVDVTTTDDEDWLAGDMDTHGAHPYMNLFEGNVFAKLAHDNTFGSSSHNTSFRNHIVNTSKGKSTARWAVDIQTNNYYNTLVGNVIGLPDHQGLVNPNHIPSTKTLVSYRLGFFTPSVRTASDPRVAATTLIHGNYSFIGQETQWDPTISSRSIPASLYLESKPSFFGSKSWPAFGPDLEPKFGRIPAEDIYDFHNAPRPIPPLQLRIHPK